MSDEITKRTIVKSWIADVVIKHLINNDEFKKNFSDDEWHKYGKIFTEVMNDFHLKL